MSNREQQPRALLYRAVDGTPKLLVEDEARTLLAQHGTFRRAALAIGVAKSTLHDLVRGRPRTA